MTMLPTLILPFGVSQHRSSVGAEDKSTCHPELGCIVGFRELLQTGRPHGAARHHSHYSSTRANTRAAWHLQLSYSY